MCTKALNTRSDNKQQTGTSGYTLNPIEFSVIIPTYNRPQDLYQCIRSVCQQTRLPAEVIIINDGVLSDRIISKIEKLAANNIKLTITSTPSEKLPGSGSARNTGLEIATGSVIVFLDDDTILGATYLDRLYNLYDLHDSSELAGIGGLDSNIKEHRTSPPYDLDYVYDFLFYQGVNQWKVNKAGFSVRTYSPGKPPEFLQKADWLVGNNMSFKREIISEYQFPQWERGREPAEDLITGLQLKQDGYYCLIDPDLPIEHKGTRPDEIDIKRFFRSGRNRVRAFRQFGRKRHIPLFIWAIFGEVLRKFIVPLHIGDPKMHFIEGLSILVGVLYQIFDIIYNRIRYDRSGM